MAGLSESRAWQRCSKGLCVLLVFVLAGCSTAPPKVNERRSSSRYTLDQDVGPQGDFDSSSIPEPVPQYEPYSRGGNKSPYEVWGKSYSVLTSAQGYKEQGLASWYGAKFHGHKTSNGEEFSMYTLSAAHRSLPLPSFARITNLDNGRSIIVRVNDRGPFHGSRLIDLSFAAAHKLGYAGKGTANVAVEAIVVGPDGRSVGGEGPVLVQSQPVARKVVVAAVGEPGKGLFVQVGAFSSKEAATRLSEKVRDVTPVPVKVVSAENGEQWHRVRVGPLRTQNEADALRELIESRELGSPMVVTRPLDGNS